MKVNYEIVNKRRNDIMALIQKLGTVSSTSLASEFNVSEITIRRDLQHWEDQGAIIRHHGGAKLVQKMVNPDNPLLTNERYKRAIAKYAAQLVNDGDTIFINSSSTALLMIEYIVHKRVNIITNNARALFIKHDPYVTINLTGGELRYPKEVLVGEFATNNLNKINADKCFLGCSGIHYQSGMTTAILSEVAVNETMIRRTNGKVFLMADYTKINQQHSFTTATLDKIDSLITDVNISDEDTGNFEEAGLEVIKLNPLPF